jgi:predicted nucleic acid-binding protein
MGIRVYLDSCCLNRPFDDPFTPLIRLEIEAKNHVQRQILDGNIELAWSFILDHENDDNPFEERKKAIAPWKYRAIIHIDVDEDIIHRALAITKYGIRGKDALHIACAIKAQCRYFLTTDKKILNKRIEGITLMNPVEYIQEVEG